MIVLALVLIAAAAIIAVNSANDSDAAVYDEFTEDGVTYIVLSEGPNQVMIGEANVTGDYDILSSVTDSTTSTTYDVVAIAPEAFDGVGVTSVTIPATITSIYDAAFLNCTALASITVNDSNPNYSSLDGILFNKTKTILVQYPIGNTNTSYSVSAGVLTIGNYAFYGCTTLTSVSIPDSVTSIGTYVFAECSSLTAIDVDAGNTAYSSLDHVLFNKNKTELIAYPTGRTYTSYDVPAGVDTITDYAFAYCTTLTAVSLPDGLTTIGEAAFYECAGISSVNIPDGVTTIEDDTFYMCTSLSSITIPDGVMTIGSYAFYKTALTSITIPKGVTDIGGNAFEYCNSLTTVVLPSTLMVLDEYAFDNCQSLSYVKLLATTPPTYVSSAIQSGATVYVPSTSSSTYKGTAGWSSLTIKDIFIDGNKNEYYVVGTNLIIEKGENGSGQMQTYSDTNTIKDYVSDTFTSADIKAGITNVNIYAFYECTSLVSVTIPNGVTVINDSAFCGCSALLAVAIPDSVTRIGTGAFMYCTSLGTASLSSSLITIDRYAFYDCELLSSIAIPAGVLSINEAAFYGCESLVSITIPDSVTSIGEYVFTDCSSLTAIDVDAGNTAYSSLDHVLFNKNRTELIAYPAGRTDTSYAVPAGALTIADYAFDCCINLTSVTLPDGLTTIGEAAFYECTGITSVDIPNSVTAIDKYAFYGCTSMASVTISKGVTVIEKYTFEGCISLSTIMFMGPITSIGEYAFNLSDAYDVSCIAIGCVDGQLDPYKGTHTTFTYKFWVTYNMNGGSGFINPEAVNGNYTVKEYSGTKTGYRFIGWNDGAGTYAPGTSVNIVANTAYTAVWEQLYLVTYDVDGGTGSVDSEYVKGTYVLKSYLGTKDGYSFKGWSDGTTTYDAGTSVEITKDTAYKAVWEKNSSGGGSNTGLIIGIVVAVIVVIGIGAFFVIKKK